MQFLAFSYVRRIPVKCRVLQIVGSSNYKLSFSDRKIFEEIDEKLERGNERSALLLLKDHQGKPGGVNCFGAARQVLN